MYCVENDIHLYKKMSCVPHGQKYQPPAAGVSSADCWLKPDPFHNPLRQEGLPPEKQHHASVFEIICFLLVPVFIVGRLLPQRARSQSPWCQYWSSAACWPLWVSGSFLQICWRGTATVHPKHWDVPTQQTGTAYRFVQQISVFWHKMMLPCMFCSEKWKSMWGIGFT